MTGLQVETRVSPIFEKVPFDEVLKCIHCGLCLDACPTYRALGAEQDSPRGRLYLMRGLWEGELVLDDAVSAPLSRCLDCRACETACPSGVPYGELLEKTRGVIRSQRPGGFWARSLNRLIFRGLLPSTGWTLSLARMAHWYQRLGFAALMQKRPLRFLVPQSLRRGHALMPKFSRKSFKRTWSGKVWPPFSGEATGKVALFTGCVMDVAETEIHEATMDLLRAAGCEVFVPAAQTCCGALAVHQGEREPARTLALRNLAALDSDLWQAIIVNAAGCGAQLREYHHLFSDAGHQADQERWPVFARKVQDLLVFLAGIEGFPGALQWRKDEVEVLYDAPCHLIHAQRIDAVPRDLIGEIPGVKVFPLSESAYCCGAAGIYNIVQRALSEQILERKMDDIEMSLTLHPRATTLLSANPGCIFQLRAGVAARGLGLRVIHPAVLLRERLHLPV